jgi:serine/threonine-protein kinase
MDIGQYDCDFNAPLGCGQFGHVYKARCTRRGIDVALKLIPLSGPDAAIKVEAERNGALLQQEFDRAHKRLVPEIFEQGETATYHFIAMECVKGQVLTELIRQGVTSRQTAQVGLAVAGFLREAHRERLFHSDLKPAHIIVLPDNTIRVLDFGITKALMASETSMTNAWFSASYASPERIDRGGKVNSDVDLWALGVILFEMVSHAHPYESLLGDRAALEDAIRRKAPMAPLPETGDPVLRAIIEKMLAPQIEHRYRSARALCEDLMNFLDGFPTSAARQKAEAGRVTVPLLETRRQPDQPTEPIEPALFQSLPAPRTFDVGGVARAAAALLCVVVVLSEGTAAVRAERLRQRIGTLEPSDVAAVRQDLVSIYRWAPAGVAVRAFVGPSLKTRMVQLADRTILDYRRDGPVVTEAQWRQAWACLALAADVAPGDRVVDAKRQIVQGHLKQVSARVPAESNKTRADDR